MSFQPFSMLAIATLSFVIGACANTANAPTTTDNAAEAPIESPSESTIAKAEPTEAESTDHSAPAHGGQVVETGEYHLELVAVPEEGGTHLDLFLQTGDTHEAIEGATVKGQIQLPDGTQQEVDFAYDAAGEHYAAMLPETASGEYRVVILTDINGEKVNGRFSFTK